MFKRFIALFIIVSFIFSYYQPVYAQDFSVNQLPVPGTMVGESAPFTPLALKGLVINIQKPLEFQFIVDTGHGPQDTASVKNQANQLVKYFLAGITIPEGDLWVNLSPYEKNRMVPEALGQTDLGRDLLAQDYILKQLTASLIYPDKDLGKEFWSRVYAKAQQQFGTTNIPVNTFNKVWILPDQAQVFEHGASAYVTKATLKVMLDEDYLALQKHVTVHNGTDSIGASIVRQIVIPEITKEVNAGKNFAPLRQIYQALILAKWYKETIQNGLLDAVYTNKNKVAGVNLNDPAIKEQIYERYLKAYKKGAFNFIKEDPTPDGQIVPRKYFSGGIPMQINLKRDGAMSAVRSDGAMIALKVDLAMKIQADDAGEEYSGGLMGRWKYDKIEFNKGTNVLTLKGAVRLPRKDGIVEPEFLIDGENKPRDIVLKTRQLRSNEMHVLFNGLLKGRDGVPYEDSRYLFHMDKNELRVIVRNESAIKHRIYGAAVDGDPFIREDIFVKGNPEQIKEAFDHEVRELKNDLSHNQIRAVQYQGNLRELIRKLSDQDKEESVNPSSKEKGSSPLEQYFPSRRELSLLNQHNKVTGAFTEINLQFRSEADPDASYDGGFGRFGYMLRQLEESDFIDVRKIKIVNSSEFMKAGSRSFSVGGKQIYMYFEGQETLVMTQALWDQIKARPGWLEQVEGKGKNKRTVNVMNPEDRAPNLYFEMSKELILLAWSGFQGDSADGFAEELAAEDNEVILNPDTKKEQTKLEAFFYLDLLRNTSSEFAANSHRIIQYLGYVFYRHGFGGGRISIFEPGALAHVVSDQTKQLYGQNLSTSFVTMIIKSDEFERNFYHKEITDYQSGEVQGEPVTEREITETLDILKNKQLQTRLAYELNHFDTIYPGQRWQISKVEDVDMGLSKMTVESGLKLVLDYPLPQTGKSPRLYLMPPDYQGIVRGFEFDQLPSYELEVRDTPEEGKSLENDFTVSYGHTKMPLKLFLNEHLGVDLKKHQHIWANLFVVENGGEVARDARTGQLETYFIGNEKNTHLNLEKGIINGANISRVELKSPEEQRDEQQPWHRTFSPMYAPINDPDTQLVLRYHFHPTKYIPIVSSGDIESKVTEIFRGRPDRITAPELIINFKREGRLYLPRKNIHWRRALKVLRQISKHQQSRESRIWDDSDQAERWEQSSLEYEKEVARFFDIVSLRFNDDGTVKEWNLLKKSGDAAMNANGISEKVSHQLPEYVDQLQNLWSQVKQEESGNLGDALIQKISTTVRNIYFDKRIVVSFDQNEGFTIPEFLDDKVRFHFKREDLSSLKDLQFRYNVLLINNLAKSKEFSKQFEKDRLLDEIRGHLVEIGSRTRAWLQFEGGRFTLATFYEGLSPEIMSSLEEDDYLELADEWGNGYQSGFSEPADEEGSKESVFKRLKLLNQKYAAQGISIGFFRGSGKLEENNESFSNSGFCLIKPQIAPEIIRVLTIEKVRELATLDIKFKTRWMQGDKFLELFPNNVPKPSDIDQEIKDARVELSRLVGKPVVYSLAQGFSVEDVSNQLDASEWKHPGGAVVTYVVQQGDTWKKLAEILQTSVQSLRQYNDNRPLTPGNNIFIEPKNFKGVAENLILNLESRDDLLDFVRLDKFFREGGDDYNALGAKAIELTPHVPRSFVNVLVEGEKFYFKNFHEDLDKSDAVSVQFGTWLRFLDFMLNDVYSYEVGIFKINCNENTIGDIDKFGSRLLVGAPDEFKTAFKEFRDWMNDRAMNVNAKASVTTDQRVLPKGGIDLNQINVKRTGKTISVQFDQAQLNELEQSDFKGFTPMITGFRYIQSPFPLLGINNPAKEPEVLVKA